jgi:hypothetical protein
VNLPSEWAAYAKMKSMSSGLVYKIKGTFTCLNRLPTANQVPFTVRTYLSFDTFASTPDIAPEPLSKVVRKKLTNISKDAKVKYKFTTDQNPYGGAILAVADVAGDVFETNERNNIHGMLIDPSQ